MGNRQASLKVFAHTWGKMGYDKGEFNWPVGIAVGMDDRVYVSDGYNNCIQCFEADGTFVRRWGHGGKRNGEFDGPMALEIGHCEGQKETIMDALFQILPLSRFPPGLLALCAKYVGDEYVVVTDSGNCRIQRFRSDGTFICKWGSKGSGEGQFELPLSCCIDANGIIYVADTHNSRIQKFQMDGTFIAQWDTSTLPTAISIGSDGIMYVVGSDHDHPVTRFRCDGTSVEPFLLHLDRYSLLDVIVDGENENKMIYMSTTGNNSILQYRANTETLVRTWGTYGNGDGEFSSPHAMAKSPNRPLLYITDSDNYRIVTIQL